MTWNMNDAHDAEDELKKKKLNRRKYLLKTLKREWPELMEYLNLEFQPKWSR